MCSWNAPRRTVVPVASSAFAKASTRAAATSGGAAPSHDGPAALPHVAVQGELRNHEELAADVAQRAVHLAGLVFEHAEVHDLLGQAVVLAERVVLADAHQEQQPRADLGDALVADGDRGVRDALQEDAHYRGTTRNAS